MQNTYNHTKMCQFTFAFMCMVALSIVPQDAFAGPTINTTLGESLCQLINMMTGLVGKSVATLAVMFLGIGSFFGKANWGLVITVASGIALIFGAATIADGLGVTGAITVCNGLGNDPALDNAIGAGLCEVAMAIAGPMGKGLCSLAVMFVGVGCFFGKTSWSTVITTTTGIALVFGAGSIVQAIVFSAGWTNTCLPGLI